MKTLNPIDTTQCQGEKLEGSFMTLGLRKYTRCTNNPKFFAIQINPDKDV